MTQHVAHRGSDPTPDKTCPCCKHPWTAHNWEEGCACPSRQTDDVVERVRALLLQRSQTGLRKYGTPLTRTDLSVLDWHRHHLEELLDAANYTMRLIMELEKQQITSEGNQ